VPEESEIILENFLFLNSRGIIPSTLVAKGFNCLFKRTTALCEKQKETPNGRFNVERVLTITAYNTSPFFTLEVILFFDRIC